MPYETGISQDFVKTAYAPPQFIFIPSYSNVIPITRVLPFKGGTKIMFNDRGEVIRGTISISNQSIVLNLSNHIDISDGEVGFHKNGMIAICTLASNSYLHPVGWSQILTENYTNNSACSGLVEFKDGKPIELNEKGEVVKGTLNKDTKLLSAKNDSLFSPDSGGIKVYEAGTTVEFDDKGIVVKATK